MRKNDCPEALYQTPDIIEYLDGTTVTTEKQQAYNPYLPSYEYIPDGEPHVFGDRVYLYGSHDSFDGLLYCMNDYVCYSAPVTDLAEWRFEGVIYKKHHDPRNADMCHCLWAPDVTRGLDGKYYLYYCMDTLPEIGVAVCDTPAGKYEYLGLMGCIILCIQISIVPLCVML